MNGCSWPASVMLVGWGGLRCFTCSCIYVCDPAPFLQLSLCTTPQDVSPPIGTYSNIYNKPKVIQEPPKPKPIRVFHRTGVPLDVLTPRGPTHRQVESMTRINGLDLPRVSMLARRQEESKDERRARKHAIKEERKVSSPPGPGQASITNCVCARTRTYV